jgi:RNA-binding protein YlmH
MHLLDFLVDTLTNYRRGYLRLMILDGYVSVNERLVLDPEYVLSADDQVIVVGEGTFLLMTGFKAA